MPSPPPPAPKLRPLERIRGFLVARGVPVGPVVVAGGRLRLRLGSRREAVEVHVGPPGAAPPYRRIHGLAMGYSGAPQLDHEQQAWVDLVAAMLLRVGERLPALLARPDAAGTEGEPLAETLPVEFPFCTLEVTDDTDGSGPRIELLVRMTTRCNQDCPFCSAPPPLDDPPASEVTRLLDRVFQENPRGLVTLTGGEPTIRRDLPEIVHHALGGPSGLQVHVQTNAVFFSDAERLAPYPAGEPRLGFFVSLHALDEAIYDACTGTKGQQPRALEGIRNLLAAGHEVLLNCVVNRLNVGHLTAWVEGIPALFPETDPLLHFSVTMCPEHRPGASDLLVRYRELAPALERAVARAAELGIRHDPLQSSTHASLPACLVSEEAREDPTHRPRLGAHETGYEALDRLWVKAERCRTCQLDPWCLGLPRPYVQRFGLDELEPIG